MKRAKEKKCVFVLHSKLVWFVVYVSIVALSKHLIVQR